MDKVGFIQESCSDNNGARSIIHGIFIPGAMAPTHYHTLFTESFTVLEGELSVWNEGKKVVLKEGNHASVPVGNLHRFKNESDKTVKVLITLEPGHLPFEQNIKVMMGLQKDGLIEQLSKMTPKMIPVGIVLTELSDTHLVGFTGAMFRFIRLFFNKKKVAWRKEELLKKYCNKKAENQPA